MGVEHEYICDWARNEVSEENYTDAVLGLWAYDHRAYDRHLSDIELGEYQIIVFVDQPGLYYLREMDVEHFLPDGAYDYTRASCLPVPFRSLHKAKLAAEMLIVSGVDKGEPQ